MIFFLFGPDTFRSREKLRALKQKFIDSVTDSQDSLALINGKTTDLKELNEKIKGKSLFSEKKMVIIENLLENSNQELLKDFIIYSQTNKLEESQDAFIFFDEDVTDKAKKLKAGAKKLLTYLQKQKYAQEFKLLTTAQLRQWVKSELDRKKQGIAFNALEEFIKLTGNNLWQANSELQKLCHYKNGEEILLEDVKKLIKGKVEENIFALTDALGRKDFKLASKLLAEQLQTEFSEEYILSMTKRQFQLILQAKVAQDQGKTPNEIAKELGWHSFVAQKAAAQARQFEISQLKNMIGQLNHIDFLTKQGQANISTWLDLFIAKAF